MSYDLVLQPRPTSRKDLPSVEEVAEILARAGATVLEGDGTRFRLGDSTSGEVDIDVVATPDGVTKIEISSMSDTLSPKRLYEFTAATAEALGWDVFDPQGGDILEGGEVRRAAQLSGDEKDTVAIGHRTLLAAYFFLPVVFVWLVKGASRRSGLLPVVVVLGLCTLIAMVWDRVRRPHS